MRYFKHNSVEEYYRVYDDGSYEWINISPPYMKNHKPDLKWQKSYTYGGHEIRWEGRYSKLDVTEITAADLFTALL